MEAWKDIKGFENYQISTNGRVWSKIKKKYLKGFIDKDGYKIVDLRKNKKTFKKRINRLVAESFLENPDNLPQVNHKDEVKTNNKVENLEWCTVEYNLNYGTRNEKAAKALAKQVYQYTLNGELIKIWPSTKEVGRNGFKQSGVWQACNGKIKTYKGYLWNYQ